MGSEGGDVSREFFSFCAHSGEVDLFGHAVAPPKRPGRRRHVPTDARRAEVASLRDEGLPIWRIAELVGLSKCTLYVHYAAALGSRSNAFLRFASAEELARHPRPVRGRPRHQPTIATSAMVRNLAAQGASLTSISAAIGVTVPTLKRHYARELRAMKSARPGGAQSKENDYVE